MIKKCFLLVCLISLSTLTAKMSNNADAPINWNKKIRAMNNVFISTALSHAEDHFCEMTGGNRIIIPLSFQEKQDSDSVTILETKDLVAIATTMMTTIASSEEKEVRPLLKECGKEVAKTYIGNKLYDICSSYAHPLCEPRAKQLADTIEKKLPEEVTEVIHEIDQAPVYYALTCIGSFALKGAISLILDTIDTSIYANNSDGKH